jgi:hypothetical protein
MLYLYDKSQLTVPIQSCKALDIDQMLVGYSGSLETAEEYRAFFLVVYHYILQPTMAFGTHE